MDDWQTNVHHTEIKTERERTPYGKNGNEVVVAKFGWGKRWADLERDR